MRVKSSSCIPLANSGVLASIQEELASGQLRVHPLGDGDTSGFLRRLVQSLSPDGEYIGKEKPDRGSRKPQVGRYPVLFIRERMQGYSRAIELLLEDLKEEEVELPGHIKAILGIPTGEGARFGAGGLSAGTSREKGDSGDILFTKPWNREQERIVERLERYGSVVVQGPPGTGKTHTIANLIGHLLAQGKSVLVTAYSSKALAVLREKIVDSLRPLAVSVLNNDLESRAQLEEAVQAITTYLSEHNPGDLHRQADRLVEKR